MTITFRTVLVFLFDLVAPVVAWVGAFLLRFNFGFPVSYEYHLLSGLLVIVPAHALICLWAGLYRGLWIFASLPDLKAIRRTAPGWWRR